MLKKYVRNILISLDQLANSLIGGDPDWTISARLGKNYKGTWMAKLVDFLFSWQKRVGSVSHTENAAYWETDDGKDAIVALNKKDNNKLT